MFGLKKETKQEIVIQTNLLNIYILWDTVLEEGSGLFCANNDNHALRIFDQAQETNKYANETQLWRLGNYNKAIPKISHEEPRQIHPTVETTNASD